MSDHKATFLNDQLSSQTSIFGLRLWVVLGVSVGAAFVLLLFLLSLWLTSKRNGNYAHKHKLGNSHQPRIPNVSKDIEEIRVDTNHNTNANQAPVQPDPSRVSEQLLLLKPDEDNPVGYPRIHIEIGKDHRIMYPERFGGSLSYGSGEAKSGDQAAMVVPQVSHLGWGHWYTLRELEDATNGFADENVIGEGGYGIVYHGVLKEGTQAAVKNLLNNGGQAEKEFEVEVEAIGRVRHKNLVRLLGYCAEGAHSFGDVNMKLSIRVTFAMGSTEQWLHGEVVPCSPLTWDNRMKIILGTAKGYVAPEYASTGMLNVRSDVYSFGMLVMEIISGRNPVDYTKPPEEVNLIEWLKKLVSNRNPDGILDPKLPEKPSSRALKRVLLVALRCVDPNAEKRPKMGHVVHMLEAEESPFNDRRTGRDPGCVYRDSPKDASAEKGLAKSGDSNGCESEVQPLSKARGQGEEEEGHQEYDRRSSS
ncbi:hypothetical protein RJ639_010302 [Escallonia herrerae]|uniref:non-specific serine/threonine protein kinase n=1 Tax=Escallonia herrerae TaxID=1293975 RepID=A0AA89AT75_9ASTE|nr:hypothetical protein RJ639_010302 [Escallonia herrerae]